MTKGNPADLQNKLTFFADCMNWNRDDSHPWPSGKFFDPMRGCVPFATEKDPETKGLSTKVVTECSIDRDCHPTADEHVVTTRSIPDSCPPNGPPSTKEGNDPLTHLTPDPNRQPVQLKPGVTQPFAASQKLQPSVHSASDLPADQISPRVACNIHSEMAGDAPQPMDADFQASGEKLNTVTGHDNTLPGSHSRFGHAENAATVAPAASACHDMKTHQSARPQEGDVKIPDFDDAINIPDTKMDEDSQMSTTVQDSCPGCCLC